MGTDCLGCQGSSEALERLQVECGGVRLMADGQGGRNGDSKDVQRYQSDLTLR